MNEGTLVSVNNSRNGFTLIEVMAGLAIFSIGVISVLTMQLSAMKGNETSLRQTLRVSVATEFAERLMLLPYNSEELSPGEHTYELKEMACSVRYIVNEAESWEDALKTVEIFVEWDRNVGNSSSSRPVVTVVKGKDV